MRKLPPPPPVYSPEEEERFYQIMGRFPHNPQELHRVLEAEGAVPPPPPRELELESPPLSPAHTVTPMSAPSSQNAAQRLALIHTRLMELEQGRRREGQQPGLHAQEETEEQESGMGLGEESEHEEEQEQPWYSRLYHRLVGHS